MSKRLNTLLLISIRYFCSDGRVCGRAGVEGDWAVLGGWRWPGPPPGPPHLMMAGPEYSQADMAMSALYLHNINSRAAVVRPGLPELSGYQFQTPGEGEREPLL